MRHTPPSPRFGARVADAILKRPWPVVVLLVLLFGAMAWSAVREKSSTFDEIAHVTAGYSYWNRNDYRLHPENGILPQRLATLPLLAMSLEFPAADDEHWRSFNVWELGYDFFYTLGNDLDAMLWRGRGMIVLLGMALGLIVFAWSRRLFGVAGGLLSLVMYVFCPSLLAHGALATSDMAATFWFTAALGACWIALHRVSLWSVLFSGGALGGLFVSKMSAVVILPVLVLLVVIRLVENRPLILAWPRTRSIVVGRGKTLVVLTAAVLAQAALALLVIWASYGFRYSMIADLTTVDAAELNDRSVESVAGHGPVGKCIRFANAHQLLPEAYLFGFAFAVRASEARVAFLNGEFSELGWRMFFPYCLLVKTPLATLLLLLAAVAAAIARWRWDAHGRRRDAHRTKAMMIRGLYRATPLVVFLIVYWAIAIRTNLNIGHRHILPTYPMMFILGGRAAWWFQSRRWFARALPFAAVVWLMFESVTMWPNYLAYFNPVAGGPRHGYRHLVDSSLDWGQDLPGLRRWIESGRAAPQQPIYLSYFGVGLPEHFGLKTLELPSSPDWRKAPETGDLRPGVYCISATNLQHVYLEPHGEWTSQSERIYQKMLQQIAALVKRQQEAPQLFSQSPQDEAAKQELRHWQNIIRQFEPYRFARLCAYLRLREPDDSVGYSILIYNVSAGDLQTALFRPLSEWPTPPYRSD